MRLLRVLFFTALICGIGSIILILIVEKSQPPFSRSWSSLFQELGKPVKTIDRMMSKIYPIDEIDEKMLGDAIKSRIAETLTSLTQEEQVIVNYLNALVAFSTKESGKPYEYAVFLVDGSPNAFACPGGVICITKALLGILENEAELMAILGHEIGHIERGHLFDAARGEMLRRKTLENSLTTYALDTIHLLAALTFSKTQEDEADEYGFRMLLKQGYNPFAMSTSFEKLLGQHSHHRMPTDPLHDFFSTHPHTELRIEKFRSRAQLWIANFPHEKYYKGKRNLANRTPMFEMSYPEEYEPPVE